MDYLLVLAGIILLWVGGEFLVRHAVRFSRLLGVRSLVVGLTIVAFGTSSPELAAALIATLRNEPAVVLGNVVGSNILNIGLVLGLAAVFYPLRTQASLLRREFPIMIVSGLALFPLLMNGLIGRVDGILLVVCLGLYINMYYREGRRGTHGKRVLEARAGQTRSVVVAVLGIAAGVVLLTLGARYLVAGAVSIAEAAGVSKKIIGITMVAFGTSLPELVSSLVAAVRREADLILGNLVGSSIFNVLAILGIVAIVRPVAGSLSGLTIDLIVMNGFSLVALGLLAFGLNLKRGEGVLLLLLYLAYIAFLLI